MFWHFKTTSLHDYSKSWHRLRTINFRRDEIAPLHKEDISFPNLDDRLPNYPTATRPSIPLQLVLQFQLQRPNQMLPNKANYILKNNNFDATKSKKLHLLSTIGELTQLRWRWMKLLQKVLVLELVVIVSKSRLSLGITWKNAEIVFDATSGRGPFEFHKL